MLQLGEIKTTVPLVLVMSVEKKFNKNKIYSVTSEHIHLKSLALLFGLLSPLMLSDNFKFIHNLFKKTVIKNEF